MIDGEPYAPGTYYLRLVGRGDYTGGVYVPFKVTEKEDDSIRLHLNHDDLTLYANLGQHFTPQLLEYSLTDNGEVLDEGIDFEVAGVRDFWFDSDEYEIRGDLDASCESVSYGSYYLEVHGLGDYAGLVKRAVFFMEYRPLQKAGAIEAGIPVSVKVDTYNHLLYSFTAKESGVYTFCSETGTYKDIDAFFFRDEEMSSEISPGSEEYLSGTNETDAAGHISDFCHCLRLNANQTIYVRIQGNTVSDAKLYAAAGELTRNQVIEKYSGVSEPGTGSNENDNPGAGGKTETGSKAGIETAAGSVTAKTTAGSDAAVRKAVAAAASLKVTSPKAKAKAGKKAKITWKPNRNASGYQIQYSTNKKFKKGTKTVTVKGSSKKAATLKKLKAGKTYYVRIRTVSDVKNTAGKTTAVYGKWVKLKKFKAKK